MQQEELSSFARATFLQSEAYSHHTAQQSCFFVFTKGVGFPHSSVGKESACNAGDPRLIHRSGRSAEGIGYPLQYSWASPVAQQVKNLTAMQETWVLSLGWEDPLEKGKATHSSTLAWRIPWPIQSTESQRVRHDWATFTSLHFANLCLHKNWCLPQLYS